MAGEGSGMPVTDTARLFPFHPLPCLAGRHVQTIVAAKLTLATAPPSSTRVVQLADDDQIALEISTPPAWRKGDRRALLLHGLCGCHDSPYMVRCARQLWRHGIQAVRMNMRGCGSGAGLARQPYHSGRSADVLAVLQALQQDVPPSPVALVGYSLGGNIVLKFAGELQEQAARYCTQVIAVCPSADLARCAQLLGQPRNRLYERHFIRLLKVAVAARHARFADLPPVTWPKHLSLYAFDTLYTAPWGGFRDADDYYARCSAAPLVPAIRVPCHILFAADDPVIDTTVFDHVALPPNVHVIRTTHGGHMGFLGRPWRPGGYHWMDAVLLAWLGVTSPESHTVDQSFHKAL